MVKNVFSCLGYRFFEKNNVLQLHKSGKGELDMERKNMVKPSAKLVEKTLNRMLKVDANSTSCALIYQPKAPKELERFRGEK